MPELPEVQTTVNGINEYTKGLKIKEVWTNYQNLSGYHSGKDNIKNPKFFAYFKKHIVGKKITHAERRAKNILIHLDDESIILIHMKMTGHLMFGDYTKNKISSRQTSVSMQNDGWSKEVWRPSHTQGPLSDPFNRHIRFVISFSNGKHLVLSDMRRFAKVTYIDKDSKSDTEHLKGIGPEPLEESFDAKRMQERLLLRSQGKIKTVLLDPKIIAGIGNIYSDEILWLAGIHPERRIRDIHKSEYPLLYKAMRDSLLKGIDFGGDSMSDYRNILGERGSFQAEHNAYRKTGTKCKKKGCQGTIVRKIIGGRSAHFCNTHQK